ncbi:MAG: hypothetical protein MdMp024_1182 [Bacteroidales bacterium]|jgi:hypothetical protein
MTLHSDLKSLFPNPDYDIRFSPDKVTIPEEDKQAKVKLVEWTGADFHYIDKQLIAAFTAFFKLAKSPDIFRKHCDGIIAFEKDERKYLFLCELKSSFSTQHLYEAMLQLIASYIKIHMLLHLLNDDNDYICKAFIACYPPKSENFLHDLYKKSHTGKYKTEAVFSREIYFCKKTNVGQTECEELAGLNVRFNGLTFHYIQVDEDCDAKSVVVNNYL